MAKSQGKRRLKDRVLEWKVGKNIGEVVQHITPHGTIAIVEELVANSIDARAEQIWINYNSSTNELVVSDNGTGMSDLELDHFYILGDSLKIKAREQGLPTIGKFGIATTLLGKACEEYELVTQRNRIETRVGGTFVKGNPKQKRARAQQFRVTEDEHGTTIVLKRLITETGFDIADLIKSLQKGFVTGPHLQIYVDGEEIRRPDVENSSTFDVNMRGTRMGHVTGKIHCLNRPSQDSGLYVYVNKRLVGNPRSHVQWEDLRASISKKVLGFIDADGLDEAILLDRTNFQENHPAYKQFQKRILEPLREIERYDRRQPAKKKAEGLRKALNPALKRAAKALSNDEEQFTGVAGEEGFLQGEIGVFHEATKTVMLNLNHPQIRVTNNVSPAVHYHLAVLGMAQVIADHKVKDAPRNQLGRARTLEAELINRALPELRDKDEREILSPNMLYTLSHLARYSGRSLPVIKQLTKQGILPTSEQEKVLGQDFMVFEKDAEGRIALYDAMLQFQGPKNLVANMERAEARLKEAGKASEPFVTNLGLKQSPMHFILDISAEDVVTFLFKGEFNKNRTDYNPKQSFQDFGDDMYAVPQMAEDCGMTTQEVYEVLDYAEDHKLQLEQKVWATGIIYKYRDFVNTVIHMRRGK